jgi:hypothetical protein
VVGDRLPFKGGRIHGGVGWGAEPGKKKKKKKVGDGSAASPVPAPSY